MYSIGHLFMSGMVRVDESENSLFASSSIEELLIEGLSGQLDVAFLLGADIRSAVIRQSTFRCENFNEDNVTPALGSSSMSSTRRNSSITFSNVTSTVLVPYFLTHFNQINFHNSSIGSIRPNQDLLRKHSYDHISFNFLNTVVDHMESYTFNGLSVDNLNISSSTIKHMGRLAVAEAEFDRIHIADTELRMLDELVFADVRIGSLEMISTRIGLIPLQAFENSQVGNMTINSCEIKILASKAFNNGFFKTLTMKNTTVNNVEPQPFVHLQVENVDIADCAFHGSFARQFFTGLTPVRLTILNSNFSCDPHDCEINAMLLKPLRQELSWTFLGNKCNTPSTAVCSKPSTYFHEGLSCRVNWAVADCLCIETSASLTRFNTSVVVAGDCDYLKINASEGSTAALYLFRINRCHVVHIPSTIKTFEMFHTSVAIHENAMQHNRMDTLSLSHTKIWETAPNSLHNVSIGQITAEHSTLSDWDPQALKATKVAHASIMNSRLSAVRTFLDAVSHMRIQNSVLLDFDGLSSLNSVYLHNNTLLCCCTHEKTRCKNGAFTNEACVRHLDAFDCKSSHKITNLLKLMFVYICVAYVAR
ncbi:unnamed protein product [Cylicocyclus nassatus]|uniref:Uncharacterized protein n=1 Tax=Cylicocyclus nassatus TaxID=53992 RepID=A0AA36M3T8_CYLNA|nr:unnamed protein product [Cylicocyclus nassatus]